MKIRRGPRTAKTWKVTDHKSLIEWSKNWQPGHQLLLDGTIDKSGQRHTDLGIEFDAEDIAALHDAFQRFQKHRIQTLEKQEKELSGTVDLLESAFQKLENLVADHRDEAPNADALFDAIREIAEHYKSSSGRIHPPELSWIDWQGL